MHHLIATALLLTLTSCVSGIASKKPPLVHEGQQAVVRAHTQVELSELLVVATDLDGKVRARLQSTAPRPVVWRVDEKTIGGTPAAYATGGWLNRQKVVLLGRSATEEMLAHELVHWHSNNSGWPELPHLVEEGLAVFVTRELFPGGELVPVPPDVNWPVLFAMDHEAKSRLANEDEYQTFYAMGFVVVERIGLDELRRMRMRGDTSNEELMRAAGLLEE